MDNLAQQVDEIEALIAIYGNDWQVEDEENRAYSMKIMDSDQPVKLYLKLPADYPSTSPPSYELSAPHLNLAQKKQIYHLLDEVYLSLVGENVIYQWIEKIREELQTSGLSNLKDCPKQNDEEEDLMKSNKILTKFNGVENKCPHIYHGGVIIDRKSSFQGHAAQVYSVEDVQLVMKKLLENRKIEHATHNIYAYRILLEDNKSFAQDCRDDGEHQAGGRLLHFLQIVDAKNVMVVVSRWYGGIHLGPDRFRHINNSARQILESSNLITKNKDNKK